jgi:hypothetical protein
VVAMNTAAMENFIFVVEQEERWMKHNNHGEDRQDDVATVHSSQFRSRLHH